MFLLYTRLIFSELNEVKTTQSTGCKLNIIPDIGIFDWTALGINFKKKVSKKRGIKGLRKSVETKYRKDSFCSDVRYEMTRM